MPTAHTSLGDMAAIPNTLLENPGGMEVGETWNCESQDCEVAVT
jgi:hypothetical protein